MQNIGDISVGIAVYNEENNILKCLKDLEKQLKSFNFMIYVCLNGCSDHSLDKIIEYKRERPLVPINILESERGKVLAQNKIVEEIKKDKREHLTRTSSTFVCRCRCCVRKRLHCQFV